MDPKLFPISSGHCYQNTDLEQSQKSLIKDFVLATGRTAFQLQLSKPSAIPDSRDYGCGLAQTPFF